MRRRSEPKPKSDEARDVLRTRTASQTRLGACKSGTGRDNPLHRFSRYVSRAGPASGKTYLRTLASRRRLCASGPLSQKVVGVPSSTRAPLTRSSRPYTPDVNFPHIDMFRSRLRTACLGAASRAPNLVNPRRTIHHVPTLPEGDHFARSGVPDFMSQAGFKLAWSDYMGLVTEKLNELTAGDAIRTSNMCGPCG